MRNMFRIMEEKLSQGRELVMVSVIAASGSTPRGAGARMLISKEGLLCGTIGGGAVEYRSQAIAAEVLEEKGSKAHDFSLTKNDVQNLGMICGGAVKVFFKYIPAGDPETLALCRHAEAAFSRGQDMWLISEISDDGRLGIYTAAEGFFGLNAPPELGSELSRRPHGVVAGDRECYVEQLNSSGRVYVFGCGHVARELVPVLSHLGFHCIALDDRPEFASPEVIKGAEQVALIDFEHIADSVQITGEDYVCIMTRGHAFDAVVQAQVLRTPARYIGVIGSRAKKAGVYQKLKEEYGFEDRDFERISSPIGISIRAETPAEIAISIAAQLIERRAAASDA